MSAAASHFRLLDCVVPKVVSLNEGLVVCNMEHSRRAAALCMFNKIRGNPNHALVAALPGVRVPARLTRLVISVHSLILMFLGIAQSNSVGHLFLHVRSIGIL